MAKQQSNTDQEPEDNSQILSDFLEKNKTHHYNFEPSIDYKVSTGSLQLDLATGGGFGPGLVRFVGFTESGKTSEALEVMKNFLKMPNSRGIHIKAEGRLTHEMRARCGVDFVEDPKDWCDGKCFIFESNIYEAVVDLMRKLVQYNPRGTRYCFILDSVDGLIPANDLDKSFEESTKVAGGAVIASHFMKRMSIALSKRGHLAIFVSQVRSDIKLDPYSKAPIRQTSATGGNALLHFSNWIFEFEPRFKGDWILQNPSAPLDKVKNPVIGHWVKITFKKSTNEKSGWLQIAYPVRYGRTGGRSIWVEREIVDMLYLWELAIKKGAWINFSQELCSLLVEAGFAEYQTAPKFQGDENLFKHIESNPKLSAFLMTYFKKLITNEVQDA